MNKALEELCAALERLSHHIIISWDNENTLKDVYGWNHLPLTKHDLAFLPQSLSQKIRTADIEDIEPELLKKISSMPSRLDSMRGDLISHFYNGNATTAIPVLTAVIQWISATLDPILGWQILQDNKAMPAPMIRRLRSIQVEINNLVPEKHALAQQIQDIRNAHEAAESLPTDLQALNDARETISKTTTEVIGNHAKIIDASGKSNQMLTAIVRMKDSAEKLVNQCEDAYRITTTKGLAAAFDQRAKSLATSVWLWVIGLLIALGAGGVLAAHRIELLSEILLKQGDNPQWGSLATHVLLSLLSLGGPLWFAWLATKQIGQRFRLSEDYGYKASVAKAYEGYKKEAARIDASFEARLFASALTRLEEAPLRLVEDETHGSPWNELISSAGFQKALATVPELKSDFIDLAKRGIDQIGRVGIKTDSLKTNKLKPEEEVKNRKKANII